MNRPPVSRDQTYLSRKQLASRWSCCVETIKRKESCGLIQAVRLGKRFVRYRLSDIEQVEHEATSF